MFTSLCFRKICFSGFFSNEIPKEGGCGRGGFQCCRPSEGGGLWCVKTLLLTATFWRTPDSQEREGHCDRDSQQGTSGRSGSGIWRQETGLSSRKKETQDTKGTGNSDCLCIILKNVICGQTSKACGSVLALICGHSFCSKLSREDPVSKRLFCFQIVPCRSRKNLSAYNNKRSPGDRESHTVGNAFKE